MHGPTVHHFKSMHSAVSVERFQWALAQLQAFFQLWWKKYFQENFQEKVVVVNTVIPTLICASTFRYSLFALCATFIYIYVPENVFVCSVWYHHDYTAFYLCTHSSNYHLISCSLCPLLSESKHNHQPAQIIEIPCFFEAFSLRATTCRTGMTEAEQSVTLWAAELLESRRGKERWREEEVMLSWRVAAQHVGIGGNVPLSAQSRENTF